MLNQIILIGRMTKDPEARGKDPEKPIAYFRIAVDRNYKREGEASTDFFDCSAFGQQAKFVLQYGRKGRLVAVSGAMQQYSWQDQQTCEQKTSYEVTRTNVQFLDKKPDDTGTGMPASSTAGSVYPQSQAPAYAAPPVSPQPQPAEYAASHTSTAVSALGYPQPIPGAAAQYPMPDFSGIPDDYMMGANIAPIGHPSF